MEQFSKLPSEIRVCPFPFLGVARGEDTDTSDFDFLVDFAQGASFFDQFQMQQELSEFLKASVYVISLRALKPRDSDIGKEALLL